ncbi:MAG: translation initiation factor IF-2 N-terminal domain-containing protein, partial [Oscillospiraceae bacterium]|nr:translation initiation factor IF-2 N-terminal domain-containing protein [Oscillospiraceae bacterium]
MIKYRVHEVAKDFGTTYKALAEILTKYSETPKNHMQVLTDRELNIIFDYLTFHNQVASLDEIFAEGRPAQPKAPEKAPEPVQEAPTATEKAPEAAKPQPQKQAPAQGQKPAQPAAQGQKQPQPQQPGSKPQQPA